jgi:hypothetical protein
MKDNLPDPPIDPIGACRGLERELRQSSPKESRRPPSIKAAALLGGTLDDHLRIARQVADTYPPSQRGEGEPTERELRHLDIHLLADMIERYRATGDAPASDLAALAFELGLVVALSLPPLKTGDMELNAAIKAIITKHGPDVPAKTVEELLGKQRIKLTEKQSRGLAVRVHRLKPPKRG